MIPGRCCIWSPHSTVNQKADPSAPLPACMRDGLAPSRTTGMLRTCGRAPHAADPFGLTTVISNMYICIYIYIHVYAYIHIYIYTLMQILFDVCIYIYICMYMYPSPPAVRYQRTRATATCPKSVEPMPGRPPLSEASWQRRPRLVANGSFQKGVPLI